MGVERGVDRAGSYTGLGRWVFELVVACSPRTAGVAVVLGGYSISALTFWAEGNALPTVIVSVYVWTGAAALGHTLPLDWVAILCCVGAHFHTDESTSLISEVARRTHVDAVVGGAIPVVTARAGGVTDVKVVVSIPPVGTGTQTFST